MRTAMKHYVARQWLRSTGILSNTTEWITHERTAAAAVVSVTDTMEAIVRSKGALFEVCTNRNRQWIHQERLAKRFMACLNLDLPLVRKEFPIHRLPPLYDLFEQLVEEGLRADALDIVNVPYFNAVIEGIRTAAKAKAFVGQLNRIDRMVRDNSKSLLRHLDTLFADKARPLILRIDLHYQRPGLDGGPGTPAVISTDVIREHIQALLRHLRRNYPSRLTYVWAIESGLLRGAHIHFFCALDGNMVRRDVTIAQNLCEEWAENITKRLGWFHNCHKHKPYYARRGILALGAVHRLNVTKRANLERTLLYFAKRDIYIRLEMPGLKRTLGKGILRSKRAKPRIKRQWRKPPKLAKAPWDTPVELRYEELF